MSDYFLNGILTY